MKYRLSEIMDIIGGGTPKTSKSEYWNGNIPWLSVKDFNNDYRYVYETEKTITNAGLENSPTKLLKRNDSIISARGTVGEIAMIPFPMAFNQSCYGLRAKEGIVDEEYLYYLIKHNLVNLKKNTHGSVFDTITRDIFDGIEVELPSLLEQKIVASILRDYDDKIEINARINKNLEAQAQAIFDHFYKSISGQKCALSKIIDIRDGTHDSPKAVDNGYPLVTSKHLLPFGVDTSSANIISKIDYDKVNERSKVNTGDILISMIGTVGLISYVIDSPVEFAIKNVGLFKTSQHPSLDLFILYYLKSISTTYHIEKCLAGSTQKYISLGELRKLQIVVPSQQELDTYNSVVRPIVSEITLLVQENKRLSNIRDSLLPRLMSGELDVSNIYL